jgi:hypothetical protein
MVFGLWASSFQNLNIYNNLTNQLINQSTISAGRADLLFFFNQVPRKNPGSEFLADAVKLKIKVNVRNLVHRSGVVIQI